MWQSLWARPNAYSRDDTVTIFGNRFAVLIVRGLPEGGQE